MIFRLNKKATAVGIGLVLLAVISFFVFKPKNVEGRSWLYWVKQTNLISDLDPNSPELVRLVNGKRRYGRSGGYRFAGGNILTYTNGIPNEAHWVIKRHEKIFRKEIQRKLKNLKTSSKYEALFIKTPPKFQKYLPDPQVSTLKVRLIYAARICGLKDQEVISKFIEDADRNVREVAMIAAEEI